MESRCLFIAIPIPDSIKKIIIIRQNELTATYGRKGRTVASSFHLTLKYLGNTPEEFIPEIIGLLRNIASETQPFTLSLTESSAFPNPNNPRIIYAGLTLNRQVETLVQNIDKKMSQWFKPEDKPFNPHITIFRPKIRIVLTPQPFKQAAEFQVDRFQLVESILQPVRAYYRSIESFHLLK